MIYSSTKPFIRSMKAHLIFIASILGFTLASAPFATVSAAEMPTGFSFDTVASGLKQPVAFAAAPASKFYIAEKGGTVKVYDNGRLLGRPFIDISEVVNNNQDRGLLSVAVHPNFPDTPYVYVAYTYDPPELRGQSGSLAPNGNGKRVGRLDRITADRNQNFNVAVSGSRITILGKNSTAANLGNAANVNDYVDVSCQHGNGTPVRDCLPADSLTHTVSFMKFDRSGKMLVSNGDGASYRGVEASTLRTQDLNSLAGKILRIDPITGAGLADNPHYNGNPNANISKVVSLGLRNPFRFTLHPQTGEMFIGDVGWSTWEEVNRGIGNFGWPCYEGGNGGNLRQTTYAGLNGCREFYNRNPPTIAPIYAYNHNGGGAAIQMGDFLASLRYPQQYRNALLFNDFTLGVARIAYFDSSQRLQNVENFGSGFSGSTQMSLAPDGWIYVTNINTGKFERLRHRDGVSTPIVNTSPPPLVNSNNGQQTVTMQRPTAGSYEIGTPIQLTGFATNSNGSSVAANELRWTVNLHHNEHIHENHYATSGTNGTFVFPDHGDNTRAEICLTVAANAAAKTCKFIYSRTGVLKLKSIPSGLKLLFSTATDLAEPHHRTAVREVTTPADFRVNIGGVREIRAIDSQGYQLVSWSTGETTNPVSWTMPYGEASITAIFSKDCGNNCATAAPPAPQQPVVTPASASSPTHACIDTDGDGWGWDGVESCIPNAAATANSTCVDSDGDGYGWDGKKTCLMQ